MVSAVFTGGVASAYAAATEGDFDTNTAWTLSNEITTPYTSKGDGSTRAFSLGTSKIGNISVTAEFTKQKDRNDGASCLSPNGKNQSVYRGTKDMFYGQPRPEKVSALGVYGQPSNGVGGLGTLEGVEAD